MLTIPKVQYTTDFYIVKSTKYIKYRIIHKDQARYGLCDRTAQLYTACHYRQVLTCVKICGP